MIVPILTITGCIYHVQSYRGGLQVRTEALRTSWCLCTSGPPMVLWEGYPDEEATWEPYENIKGTADEALEEFKKKNPEAV